MASWEIQCKNGIFPQTVCLTVGVKAGADQGAHSGARHFCDILTCVSTAQARTKCSSAFWAHSGARHFSCKFPYKVALAKC